MDLRGINELRPDRLEEVADDGGPWEHACSHVTEDGAGSLVRLDAVAAGVHLQPAAGGTPAETAHRLISASVLKLRGQGRGVVRLSPRSGYEADPGWDGAGWLQRLGQVGSAAAR